MLKTKLLVGMLSALAVLAAQAGPVWAAHPARAHNPVEGIVQSITLDTNATTGVSIVIVAVQDDDGNVRDARLSLEAALALGLVVRDSDGNPVINETALGRPIRIDPSDLLSKHDVYRHPVGNALAQFFSNLGGIDYEAIMAAHSDGAGFGVIAQALWLTTQLDGNSEIFQLLLEARQTNDYSDFTLEDGSTPKNWGQLRKAILEGAEGNNLGLILSNNEHGKGPENEKRNPNGNGPPDAAPGQGNQNGNGNNGNGKGKGK